MQNLTDKQRYQIAGTAAAVAGIVNMIIGAAGEPVFYSTGIVFLLIAAFFISRLRST